MSIGGLFSQVFYTGGGVSAEVPHLWPVALDGEPYLVDLLSERFKRSSIPLLRNQADTANLPGEQSINPEDLWRRAQESWNHGAGQTHLDRPESDSSRFRSSKGLNVWDEWQLTLLHEASNKRVSVATNLDLVTAGARLYVVDGTTPATYLQWTADLVTFTPVTGGHANAPTSIASDGHYIYTAHGAGGVYRSNKTISTTASWATGTVNLVEVAKGRIMAAAGPSIYDIPFAGGALPAALMTHGNTDWNWVGFAEGQGQIYAAGYSGDKSVIYRTAVKPDGTALDVPVVAGELPDGEVVRSIQGYLEFLVVGTDLGVRFATTDGQGNLQLGKLIVTNSSVRCFEPQDRFVWFGWTNYDASSTGLGRLDLSTFIGPSTPAYASDLMATGQGAVGSVVTFLTKRVFAVQGVGVFSEDANLVASGTLDSGRVTYGIPDPKVAMYVQARFLPLLGTVQLSLAVDAGTFVLLGQETLAGNVQVSLPANQVTGEAFEIRTSLLRAAGMTTGPTVTRHTLRAYPGPNRGEIFLVPLVLHETLDVRGQERIISPLVQLNRIRQLIRDHRLVTYQEGTEQYSVFLEDYEWAPIQETIDGRFWQGICTVKLKAVTDFV